MGRKRLDPKPLQYLPPAAWGVEPGDKDEFGLPIHWTLLEGEDATTIRQAKLSATMRRLFESAVRHLGEVDAVKAWAAAGRQKPGAKKGTARNPVRDDDLLQSYDAELAKGLTSIEALPRLVAETAKRTAGETAESTEKHLRRLLRKRSAACLVNAGPPTLLGVVKGQE